MKNTQAATSHEKPVTSPLFGTITKSYFLFFLFFVFYFYRKVFKDKTIKRFSGWFFKYYFYFLLLIQKIEIEKVRNEQKIVY